MGFPIRKSRDQRVLSPPPGLSQSATSFIASCRQGIHQTPFSRLIRSGGGATPLAPRRAPSRIGKSSCSFPGIRERPEGRNADPGQCFDLERLSPVVPPPPRAARGTDPPRGTDDGRTRALPHSGGPPKTSRVSLSSRCHPAGLRRGSDQEAMRLQKVQTNVLRTSRRTPLRAPRARLAAARANGGSRRT